MSNSPPVFTSRRDPDAEPFALILDVEREDPTTGKRVEEQHTFTCRAQLNAGTMLDLHGAGQRLGYDGFMAQALGPTDRERWAELIRDPDVYVAEGALEQAVQWVVEQYAARPTTRSDTSPSGPRRTGSGSTDTPPTPATTSEPSPPTVG